MKSFEARSVIPLVAVCAALYGTGCSGSGVSIDAGDAAAEGSSGSSGSSGGSGSSSGSSGSSGGSGSSSGSSGSSGGSGSSSGSSGSSSGSGTGDGGTCASDADCGTGGLCGFPKAAGCSAAGTCFPAPGVTCQAISLACACDGTDINVACNGLPDGYAPKPFAHSGTCGLDAGSGADGGSVKDAGTQACGPYSCDVATSFCYEAGGGAVRPDGGSNFTYACNPIPAQCQPTPTCACVIAADAGTHGCPCSVQPDGALRAACLYP